MNNMFSISFKIFLMNYHKRPIPKSLVDVLLQFTEIHHHIENKKTFIERVIKPHTAGNLILFYGESDQLVGYTRIYQHQLEIKSNLITIFSAKTYSNPTHNTLYAGARLGLTHTMKYKLAHPEEELVHFSSVTTPYKYQFLSHLSNTVYPRPHVEVPKHILVLVNFLKEANDWSSSETHPMLIHDGLQRKLPLTLESIPEPTVADYFDSLNSEINLGFSLLVCIPLNLCNISYGIRKILMLSSPVMQPSEQESRHSSTAVEVDP